MNPELKKIGNKLFLGTQKVELAELDPKKFDSLSYKLFSEANRYAESQRNTIVQNYRKTLESITEVMKAHSSEYDDLVKKAKDLGLDFSTSQIGKQYLNVGTMISKYHKETLTQMTKFADIKP